MNPQQPYGAFPPPPPGSNPYEFITGAPQKPPRKLLLGGGNSFTSKLLLIVGGAVALIVVGFVAVNLLFGGSGNFSGIIGLAQTQQEIARVAGAGKQGLSDQAIAGAAINTRLTMLTQQQQLVAYLGENDQKVDNKRLAEKKNATTDKQFQQAKSTSTFDIIFAQTLRQQLTAYSEELQTAFKNAPGPEARKLITADYQQTLSLLKQLPEQP